MVADPCPRHFTLGQFVMYFVMFGHVCISVVLLQSTFTRPSGCKDFYVSGSTAGHCSAGTNFFFSPKFDLFILSLLQLLSENRIISLEGVSSHGAPAGSVITPWGWLTLPPPVDPAVERPEASLSRSGNPQPGSQPAPQQPQVKNPPTPWIEEISVDAPLKLCVILLWVLGRKRSCSGWCREDPSTQLSLRGDWVSRLSYVGGRSHRHTRRLI